MPSKKAPLALTCVSDKETPAILATNPPVEPQVEVKIQPPKVDEFDDEDAVEALVAAEAEGKASDPA